HGKYDQKLSKAAANWKEPDDVLEALFGLCRKAVENEPLKIFMALSDLDRDRQTPLEPDTVDRLARQYRQYGSQYPIFNEVPTLTDKSILKFLDTAESINRIKDQLLRSDTAGSAQALIGLWEIFVRQGSIPASQADAVFSTVIEPFGQVREDEQLFDAARGGVGLLLKAANARPGAGPQERIIDLLAGTANPTDVESHRQVAQEITRILEAQ